MALRPVLVVEDDPTLRSILAEQLVLAGNVIAEEAESAGEADAKLAEANKHYVAILLDVGLPDADGRDFCAKLRRDGRNMPIIMLADKNTEQDVVRGLDAGANDYITKPFRPLELLARIRTHIRIFDNSPDAVFILGPYLFRPTARLLIEPRRKQRVWLTGTECSILKCLYRANGNLVSRQALLSEVWSNDSAASIHTLETHVWRLRQKIERDPDGTRLLPASRGGYKLGPAAFASAT
jgi:DNA-binding response OmpR family regulator